jgi:hypothetical protein
MQSGECSNIETDGAVRLASSKFSIFWGYRGSSSNLGSTIPAKKNWGGGGSRPFGLGGDKE